MPLFQNVPNFGSFKSGFDLDIAAVLFLRQYCCFHGNPQLRIISILIQNGSNFNGNFCGWKNVWMLIWRTLLQFRFSQSDNAAPVTQLFSWESTAEDNWTNSTAGAEGGYICYLPKPATLYFSLKTLASQTLEFFLKSLTKSVSILVFKVLVPTSQGW